MDNLGPSGSLDTDKFARAILMHRNQTDPTSGLSPAQVIFGRQLRDHLPLQPEKFQPRAEWRMEADQREKTYMKRHILKHEQLSTTAKNLPGFDIGDTVAIQDKSDPGKAGKWTKTGTVTDSLGFQSYEIKVDGSNHLTTRNRAHLRKILPFINEQMEADRHPPPSLEPIQTRARTQACPTHANPVVQQPDRPVPPHPLRAQTEPAVPTAPAVYPTSAQPTTHLPTPTPVHNVQPRLRTRLPVKEKWIVRSDWKPPTVVPNTMTTVQAIIVTYPVSGSEGEGFTNT